MRICRDLFAERVDRVDLAEQHDLRLGLVHRVGEGAATVVLRRVVPVGIVGVRVREGHRLAALGALVCICVVFAHPNEVVARDDYAIAEVEFGVEVVRDDGFDGLAPVWE